MSRRILILFAVLALAVAALSPVAAGANSPAADDTQTKTDDRSHPLGDQQRELRSSAAEAQLLGKTSGGPVHEVTPGQYVELERVGEDSILTILGEFGDFSHNSIAEPDRTVDNTTMWTADFNRDHYMDILFDENSEDASMRDFYIELSSNRYTVNGDVSDWTLAPDAACTYGEAAGQTAVWNFLIDSTTDWYNRQIADGKTDAEINDYLTQFDVWDRYDWDLDGNFDEPDGYIDHFQSVHAGEGLEAGGGSIGGCAIWSHRWYTHFNLIGVAGPSLDYLIGGIQLGGSDFWIGDYTIEPENGGVGVFAHEFAHDLGLPDLYNTGGGPENSTGYWTLMSSGSWLGEGTVDIGTKPGHMGAWEKFQLGWLNYEVAYAGAKSSHKMGPAATNTKQVQGLFVVLPDKEVTSQIADPYEGSYFYYSDAGNDIDTTMTNSYTLATGSSLMAKANVQIETDWDYAYLIASTDGGATWENVETTLSTTDDPNGQNFGFGITGNSGGWVDLTADLSAYEGDVMLGFRYWTDGVAVEPGFMLDNIVITGYPLDGAEADAGWTFDGYRVTSGSETASYFNAYVAEHRTYQRYDEVLETGPYNFGFLDNPALGNYVEHFPYQDGLLISYWDTSEGDNNTATHPGSGLILPIDAHPEVMYRADGGVWRNRIQSFDSTFGLQPTDALTLHSNSVPSDHPSQDAVPVFDDRNSYWSADNRTGSVIVPNTGTQIVIRSVSARGAFMQVQVTPAK